MKRTLIALAAFVLLFGSVALAEELQPGQKASDGNEVLTSERPVLRIQISISNLKAIRPLDFE